MRKVRLFAVMLLVIALLATSAFAAADNFVPSIEQNDAPAVTATADGSTLEIIVTPYSRKDSPDTNDAALAAKIKSGLEQAMSDLNAARTLGDLKSADGTVQGDLGKAIEGTDYTVNDLVVTDLFDVSVGGDYSGSVTLDIAKGNGVLAVLHSPEPGVWEVVDNAVSGNHTTLTVDNLSPFALVAAKTEDAGTPVAPGQNPVTSPQTGETVNSTVLAMMAILLLAAVVCFARARRHAQ